MDSRRATISYAWYHDLNLAVTSQLLWRDIMDSKIYESSKSLRTQQLATSFPWKMHMLKKEKKRNAKAVKVTAVHKCQIGLRGATWIWIFNSGFLLCCFWICITSTMNKWEQDFPLKQNAPILAHMGKLCKAATSATIRKSRSWKHWQDSKHFCSIQTFVDLCSVCWNWGEEQHRNP